MWWLSYPGGWHDRGNRFQAARWGTLSLVNWLEFLGLSDRVAEIAEVRRVLASKRKIGGTARLAVLDMGQLRSTVRNNSQDTCELSVKHEPETDPTHPADLSHSGIHGVPPDDNTVPELLARIVLEAHRAS